MHSYKRFASLQQMATALGVFAALMLVLESGGLLDWAQRLDLGPERTIALPLTSALHLGVQKLGLERARHSALLQLARTGWSDDPQIIAEAHTAKKPANQLPPPVTTATVSPLRELPPSNKSVPATPMLPLKPMAGDPPLVTKLPPIAAVHPGKVRTVALTGDSMMAVGLSSTILREAPQYKDLAIVKTFKSGTGLARPEVFNWQDEYPAMLHTALVNNTRPDVVVVAIGANDGQGFVENGVTYVFGTSAWQGMYQRRVQNFLALLERDGATVVWMGLPPMKNGVYDSHIALVNRIDYAVVSASPQAIWFSTAGLIGDDAGRFRDFGQVRGNTTRLRQQDGIHLSDDGATLLSEKLLPWLARQATEPAPAKETAAVDPSTTVAEK
jgi:hypothetical protein